MTRDVVLATHNAHKVAELQRILGAALGDVRLVAYDGPEPVEDGVTFEENALIKARAAAAFTGLPALADDSGICVDILGGSPGIFSARWGGPARDAAANLDLLLWQLSDVAEPHRAGRFACAAALVLPDGTETALRRDWTGRILTERHGEHGFGYDPIFLPDDADVSAAELAPEEKDARSHRTLAFTALAPEIRRLLTD
jgi:XTP/dITP diphosphohydrolase